MLPDVTDNASEQEQKALEVSLAKQLGRSNPEQYQFQDGSWPTETCVDCDLPIEPARLAMGRVRCFHCQDAKESRQRRGLM